MHTCTQKNKSRNKSPCVFNYFLILLSVRSIRADCIRRRYVTYLTKVLFDEYIAGGFLILYTCSHYNFYVQSILDNTVKRKQGCQPMSIREKLHPRLAYCPQRFMVAHSEFKERQLKGGECLWKLIPRQMPLKAARFIYCVPFYRELYAKNFSAPLQLF